MLELKNPKPKLLCAETIRSEQKIPFCASAQGGEDLWVEKQLNNKSTFTTVAAYLKKYEWLQYLFN